MQVTASVKHGIITGVCNYILLGSAIARLLYEITNSLLLNTADYISFSGSMKNIYS
jgi:hypothetical protein